MAWWTRYLNREANPSCEGDEFRVAFMLYSEDGQREVELREFRNGQTYLVEREWVEGASSADRHSGRMVGPFASPKAAERFIVATAWFPGRKAAAGDA